MNRKGINMFFVGILILGVIGVFMYFFWYTIQLGFIKEAEISQVQGYKTIGVAEVGKIYASEAVSRASYISAWNVAKCGGYSSPFFEACKEIGNWQTNPTEANWKVDCSSYTLKEGEEMFGFVCSGNWEKKPYEYQFYGGYEIIEGEWIELADNLKVKFETFPPSYLDATLSIKGPNGEHTFYFSNDQCDLFRWSPVFKPISITKGATKYQDLTAKLMVIDYKLEEMIPGKAYILVASEQGGINPILPNTIAERMEDEIEVVVQDYIRSDTKPLTFKSGAVELTFNEIKAPEVEVKEWCKDKILEQERKNPTIGFNVYPWIDLTSEIKGLFEVSVKGRIKTVVGIDFWQLYQKAVTFLSTEFHKQSFNNFAEKFIELQRVKRDKYYRYSPSCSSGPFKPEENVFEESKSYLWEAMDSLPTDLLSKLDLDYKWEVKPLSLNLESISSGYEYKGEVRFTKKFSCEGKESYANFDVREIDCSEHECPNGNKCGPCQRCKWVGYDEIVCETSEYCDGKECCEGRKTGTCRDGDCGSARCVAGKCGAECDSDDDCIRPGYEGTCTDDCTCRYELKLCTDVPGCGCYPRGQPCPPSTEPASYDCGWGQCCCSEIESEFKETPLESEEMPLEQISFAYKDEEIKYECIPNLKTEPSDRSEAYQNYVDEGGVDYGGKLYPLWELNPCDETKCQWWEYEEIDETRCYTQKEYTTSYNATGGFEVEVTGLNFDKFGIPYAIQEGGKETLCVEPLHFNFLITVNAVDSQYIQRKEWLEGKQYATEFREEELRPQLPNFKCTCDPSTGTYDCTDIVGPTPPAPTPGFLQVTCTETNPSENPDLNPKLKPYHLVNEKKELFEVGDHIDLKAPKLQTILNRIPEIENVYALDDPTDWEKQWPVHLIGFKTNPGESIRVPVSGYELTGGYEVVIIYADEDALTIKYTEDDNVVIGYTIQFQNIRVDPELLERYRENEQCVEGLRTLPAYMEGDVLGTATNELIVAIRDTGAWMDPRWKDHWWQSD